MASGDELATPQDAGMEQEAFKAMRGDLRVILASEQECRAPRLTALARRPVFVGLTRTQAHLE